ncbi:GMP synthase, small subunit [Methanothermus fervidus DSM 2088]|uniref:GMP synthase [glutamine-hydrolyzing] subunit A n=1 Tax=Methanothermus fervidus (strain ATCC 43054 / DSM 2088 / JCM 10308 / V24 S) TaxID=523846 RepID=E3GYC8_METFV|nr:GMP synthase subunit A [Methanothermus fervidus]ADP77310.1 GMP synthase, small subunit [Methanothermus fervidus DSM 2088]
MIVIIDNYGQYNHRIYRTLRYLGIKCKLIENNTSVKEIEKMDPLGLIIGGGPSIERSGNCKEYIKKLDIPILGICLGHQLIALVFGGKLRSAEFEEYAMVEIDIIDENDIFIGLGPKMRVWASHKDEVIKLPSNFELLASSKMCKIEAMKHCKKPIYGVQFHPEVHHTENGEKIFANFYEVCKR